MRFWLKAIKGEKLIISEIFEFEKSLTKSNWESMVHEMCYKVDLSTPISLTSHFNFINNFNTVTYLKRDFVEDIIPDKIVIENCIE